MPVFLLISQTCWKIYSLRYHVHWYCILLFVPKSCDVLKIRVNTPQITPLPPFKIFFAQRYKILCVDYKFRNIFLINSKLKIKNWAKLDFFVISCKNTWCFLNVDNTYCFTQASFQILLPECWKLSAWNLLNSVLENDSSKSAWYSI